MKNGKLSSMVKNLVLTSSVKRVLLLGLVLLTTVSFQHCEMEYSPANDESGRYYSKPLNHTANVLLTFNEENRFVKVTVYSGIIDYNDVEAENTFYKGVSSLRLQTEKYYTLVATYLKNGRKYQVVNSVEMNIVEKNKGKNNFYYKVQNVTIDLRLRS